MTTTTTAAVSGVKATLHTAAAESAATTAA
jgi:hypothetical protein